MYTPLIGKFVSGEDLVRVVFDRRVDAPSDDIANCAKECDKNAQCIAFVHDKNKSVCDLRGRSQPGTRAMVVDSDTNTYDTYMRSCGGVGGSLVERGVCAGSVRPLNAAPI